MSDQDIEQLEHQELDVEPGAVDGAAGEPAQPAPEGPSTAPGIAYNERVLCLGKTRSGKSELLNHLFGALRCQRLLFDSKDEFEVPDIEQVSQVDELDWSQPILHYVPRHAGDRHELEQLFATCFRRRHLVVAAHELGDVCRWQPGAAPNELIRYLSQGRAHGLGFLGGSQRPVSIPVHARTEAEHVFIFVPRLSPQDHATIAETIGMGRDQLAAVIDGAHAELGDHAFLWWNRNTNELTQYPPLPDPVRNTTPIARRTVA